jgi:UDP-N-acetylglucosamine 1-carboxyvinyltransferase
MTVTLVTAAGTSTVIEGIFDNRFKYADELTLMGANIKVEGNVAVIEGVATLKGAQVNALDLRAGAALVLAGLGAEGYTIVEDIHFIQRGYEDFPQKITKLGGTIGVVNDDREIQKFKFKTA